MKKWKILSILAMLVLVLLPVAAEEEKKAPMAKGAVLLDERSGTVLYGQDEEKEMDPASLTKIMTALIAEEELGQEKALTMSKEAFGTYSHDYGVLWIAENETLSVQDCVYAAMLASANDATAMLSFGVSGSNEAFVEKMNQKAEELELSHTHFSNSFGWNNESNYSSALDMANLTRAALKNEDFAKAFGASGYQMQDSVKRVLKNDCALLTDENSYEGIVGAKIGSTEEGGYALTAVAERNGTRLVAVVLGEPDAESAYREVRTLLDYGFEKYQTVTITSEQIPDHTVAVKQGKKHVYDVTFSVDGEYSILLSSTVDPSQVTYEVLIQNEDRNDPDVMEGDVVISISGKESGTVRMKKTVVDLRELEDKNKQLNWLDLVSLAVLAAVLLFKPLYKFFTGLMPPKE